MHTEQTNLAEEQSSQDEVLNTENSMLSSGEMVLMQTARSDINNPDNGFKKKYTYASRLGQSTNVHNRITGQEDESRNWKKRGNHAGNIWFRNNPEDPDTDNKIGHCLKRSQHSKPKCKRGTTYRWISSKMPGQLEIIEKLEIVMD